MKYSVIIPLKDEEQNVRIIVEEVEAVMNAMRQSWELICVDDGSNDATLTILRNMQTTKPYLHIIKFLKNYGQSAAFDAGFKMAKGEYIITLDGDGQNDPSDIPLLTQHLPNYDLVCGIRKKRKDNWLKRLISYIANSIRSRICQDGIKDTGCSLKIYKKSCLEQIKLFQGMHRFLPALFLIEGFSIMQIPVHHRQRTFGKSKYGFHNRFFKPIIDMIAVRWMNKRRLNYQIEKIFHEK